MKEIHLTQGKIALVDDADFEWLSQRKWYAVKLGRKKRLYAARRGPSHVQILMHREILDAPHGTRVDHADDNGLNNQRINIRFATMAQNVMNRGPQSNNTGKYKGVTLERYSGKWIAHIKFDGRKKRLGAFATPELAAQAYNEAAKIHFGEFAWLNPLPQGA